MKPKNIFFSFIYQIVNIFLTAILIWILQRTLGKIAWLFEGIE